MSICEDNGSLVSIQKYTKRAKTSNRADNFIEMLKNDNCIICQTAFCEHIGIPGFGVISYDCSCTKVMTTHISCWCGMVRASGNRPVKCPQCCKLAWVNDESGDQVDLLLEKRQENSIGNGYDFVSDASTHEYTDEDNIDVGPFEDDEPY